MKTLLAIVLLLAVSNNARGDTCDLYAQMAAFDEFEASDSTFNQSSFHQAMCDNSVQITEQRSAAEGGLRFGIDSVSLGLSAQSASEYRSNYQKVYCSTSSGGATDSARKYIRSKTVNSAWVAAIDSCVRSREANLTFEVSKHGTNSDIVAISFSYRPSVEPKKPQAFKKIMITPAGAVRCDGAPVADAVLNWKEYYAITCERISGHPQGALVTIVTTAGFLVYPFPDSPSKTSLETLKTDLAKTNKLLATTAGRHLECKTIDASGPRATYSEIVVAIPESDVKDGWVRTGGGCHLPTGPEEKLHS
jgi:hypothetical protein